MKLALGTVQFGLNYGAFNRAGQVKIAEVRQILDLARSSNIKVLDTAHAYGNSENVLGELNAGLDFRIVTKAPPLEASCTGEHIRAAFAQSLDRLRVPSVHGLLLHRADDLLGSLGAEIWQAVEELRESGHVARIGFSAYGPDEAKAVLMKYPVQIIQIPLNIFDTRHLDQEVLEICQSKDVEIHVRSVFLQGFALGAPEQLKGHLSNWKDLLTRFQNRCDEIDATPLQAALRYVMDIPQVDQVVIGVDSAAQLIEILGACHGPDVSRGALHDFSCGDLDLIEPRRWR